MEKVTLYSNVTPFKVRYCRTRCKDQTRTSCHIGSLMALIPFNNRERAHSEFKAERVR